MRARSNCARVRDVHRGSSAVPLTRNAFVSAGWWTYCIGCVFRPILVAHFAEADATGTRRDLVHTLTPVDLLVLEAFGINNSDPRPPMICSTSSCRRHETASTLITMNRPTQD